MIQSRPTSRFFPEGGRLFNVIAWTRSSWCIVRIQAGYTLFTSNQYPWSGLSTLQVEVIGRFPLDLFCGRSQAATGYLLFAAPSVDPPLWTIWYLWRKRQSIKQADTHLKSLQGKHMLLTNPAHVIRRPWLGHQTQPSNWLSGGWTRRVCTLFEEESKLNLRIPKLKQC